MMDSALEERVSFLSLPVEVIDSFVLPHLEWNDVLRFRRVCKWTKEITHGYLRVHPELAPEIQIDEEGDKSFRAFLRLNIPTTRIFLNNLSGDEFYQRFGGEAQVFVLRFGRLIKHLRVVQVSRYMYGVERSFLNCLKNLETFEADHFGYGRKVGEPEIHAVLERKRNLMINDSQSANGQVWCPWNFDKLKSLKISHNDDIVYGNFLEYNDAFIFFTVFGTSLQFIRLPISLKAQGRSAFGVESARSLLNVAINTIMIIVLRRADPTQWKVFDFGGFHGDLESSEFEELFIASHFLMQLCEVCLQNNVKLMNLHSVWFRARDMLPLHAPPQLGIPVVSMVNLHPWILPLDLRNLERLEIRETSKSSAGLDWIDNRRDWPALKCLDITIDSKEGRYSFGKFENEEWGMISTTTSTQTLFQFLFEDFVRPSVEELRLNFTKEAEEVFVPNLEDIAAACPNLRKLTIIKWPGGNGDLVKMWEGLENLEEIHLESCEGLDDSSFLGEDETSPVFLKLTKLSSLTLKGMENWNITDKLFSSVFRQMSLKRLILASDHPLKSVTIAGLQSLLEGCFADSIEKFPFQEWSLADVPKEDFLKLERKFRSYDML